MEKEKLRQFNVMLSEDERDELKILAITQKRRGASELAREAIQRFLKEERKKKETGATVSN